jgi:type I restriction enzyme S subunit
VTAAWQLRSLRDVCGFEGGSQPPKSEFSYGEKPGYVRFLQIRDFASDKHSTYIRHSKKNRLCVSEDILIGRYGASVGKILTGKAGAYNVALMKTIPDFGILDRSWFFSYLISEEFQSRLLSVAARSAQAGFSKDDIGVFPILVPPLSEQQRIVAILDKAFEGIAAAKANAEKNLQNAREIFESYLKHLFIRRGQGWVEKRLDEICTFSSGGTPSKQNAGYWKGNIPWISGRDMKSTRLSDSHLHISKAAVDGSATRMAPPGTLLVLVRGMGLAHGAQIGELMVACAFNQDIRGIHPIQELVPRYLLFALRHGINSSDTVLSNAAHGTLKIDSTELQKVLIPFPRREEQLRIVASLDTLVDVTQRLTAIYERKLAALNALKKSLLHRAFAGELTADRTSELIEAVA